MGSCGVGPESRLLPKQEPEGIWDAGAAAPSLPAWPHVTGIPAPVLPGWQGTPSAEQLQHLNSRHPRRPWTPCHAQVPLPRDSNSRQTVQAAGEETLQCPTAALVNHLFGFQLNFCSPLATLPATLQDGHSTALIHPPDRMRPWEDKQQTH